MTCYSKDHFDMAVRCASYIIRTREKGIIYSSGRDPHGANTAYCYSDADLGADATRRSRSGRLAMMNGAAVICRSKLQSTVEISTVCAELISMSECILDAMGIRNILSELNFTQDQPTVVLSDAMGAISVVTNPGNLQNRTKHMDLRVHACKQFVEDESVVIAYVKTQRMIADILTKALPPAQFEILANALTGYTVAALPRK